MQRLALCPEIRLCLLSPSVDLDGDAREFLGERATVLPGCDVLLASDVLYESETAQWLAQAAERVNTVLVADPGRCRLTLQGLEALWECEARTVPEIEETTPGAPVYRVSDWIG